MNKVWGIVVGCEHCLKMISLLFHTRGCRWNKVASSGESGDNGSLSGNRMVTIEIKKLVGVGWLTEHASS